jgi:radical SAM/Cys-rich protein
MRTLRLAGNPLASAERQLELLGSTGVPPFEELLLRHGLVPFDTAKTMDVLQVNVGKLCNQTCGHCHVDAGPDRRESMTRATAEKVIALLARHPIPTLDITGGAPEMNPNFGYLVTEARKLGRHVMDRCNLTILLMNGYEELAEFLASNKVEIVASLPSFRQSGTDAQRGEGVFERSIRAMQLLNGLGYGKGDGLKLNLVHNPVGAFLPGSQASIERDYRRELSSRHGVVFDNLYTITNMPISRFLDYLETSGNLQRYMELLVQSFNASAAREVMCRSYVSVGWDGTIYDCDFNQMLDLPAGDAEPLTLDSLLASGELQRKIRTARHCFGCTAGAGSSCGGTVAE